MQNRREFLRMGTLGAAAVGLPRLAAGPGPAPVVAAGGGGPSVPPAYRAWQERARGLLEPLRALMRPGRAGIPIVGHATRTAGARSDRLESFARTLLLAAFYLQSAPGEDALPGNSESPDEFRRGLARWYREGLVAGSDPKNQDYFGPDANYAQFHVEMGLLAIALQVAPRDLWDPLGPADKDQVARWLESARGCGIANQNHYFMVVHVLEFLEGRGYHHPSNLPLADELLSRLEGMHRGGGWFQDGVNQAYDYYNAYAFHFYGLFWTRFHGARDELRARRWRDWARAFAADYEHAFAASGEHPAFGRSITYRFAASNVFGMALAEACCDAPPGRLRRLCTRNLDYFLSRPIRQSQGCLSLGWVDHFEPVAEWYSCAASPYWASKGFAALLLRPEHPFWTADEEPLLSERADGVRVVRPAGLVFRSVGGEVEIINAGSQISEHDMAFGTWKWSKTAFRTGVGFAVASPPDTQWSADSALTQQIDDGRVFGRHATFPVEMDEAHVVYTWSLGSSAGQVSTSVDTGVWWRAGWILQVHRYLARQPGVLRLGGYSLARSRPDGIATAGGHPRLEAWAGNSGTVLQALHGFTRDRWDARLDDARPRTHIVAPYHVAPVFETRRTEGPGWLAALAWAGTSRDEARPWTLVSASASRWELSHPSLGRWAIAHALLPAI